MSGTKPRILVIRGGAIGDFILTLPAIKLLRDAFPNAHLEILGYEHIVALADGRYYADATRSIEYGPMAGFFVPNGTLAEELKEYFASFQQIVSYLYDPDGFFESNLKKAGAKNILPAYSKIDDSEHASRQLARPLQRLALFLDEAETVVYPSESDRAAADRRLIALQGKPLIAIHPGSGGARKNWSLENWRELITRLQTLPASYGLIVVGGEADRARLGGLTDLIERSRGVILEDLPLPELAAVISQCRLFLGHDSGVSHLAAAAGTRSLLLFGPTDPQIWAPANPHAEVIAAPEGDLAELSVEEVWGRLVVLLED